ncbi:MAG: hypothetical protein BMS9Abin34_457 [Patescibacteria group bacterium]|nr:MAG: hypothetical protein BMS9Abin34_457 [Patescibacteria group bacterium]
MKLKLFLIPLIALALLSFKAAPAHAGLFDLWGDVKCLADLDCTVQTASTAGMNYITNVLVGKDFEDITEDDATAMIQGNWDKGLASAVGEIGGLAYSFPPIHFGDYVKTEFADNLLNSSAQAQSAGADALFPVQDVWGRMRDVAYGLFAAIMVAIGFMIMLRKEISPRVVVTFTSALPKILLGLVLITFSFPIVALVIDVGAVLGSQLVLQITEGLFGTPAQQLQSAGVAATFTVVPVILLGLIISGVSTLGFTPLVALVFFVVLALVVVALMVMVIVQVIISYTWLLLYTIFAPFLLLFGALPGQEGSMKDFFKKIIGKALVFPVILFFILLALGFATEGFIGATGTFLSGEFGNLFSGALSTQGLLGVVLGLIMLAVAFKAPGLLENAIEGGGKKGKKK